MNIKIVTMNSSYNYGAMLQAYALQETLKLLGHNCEFIDQRIYYKRNVQFTLNIKSILKNILNIIYKNQLERGYRNFESFITQYQHLTKENYSDFQKLVQSPPKADAYITGSDQVWNPISFRPINFLDFVDDKTKKISYAASIGVSVIPEDKKEKFKEYINRFDFISMREDSAKQILSNLTNKEIHTHLDPVFLLSKNNWTKLCNPIINIRLPYILCYIMYRPEWLNKYLKEIKKKTGLPIILIDNSSFRNIYHDKMIRNAGPREFLWLFENAEMIITSSFHGTAFAALYNKPFYTIVNPAAPARISELTSKLFLNNTILESGANFNFPSYNYSKTNEVINQEKDKALNYLKYAINTNHK